MKYLYEFDLFGKEPNLYYKGKSQKNTIQGLIFTLIYVPLFLIYLIYKLDRMIKRKDVVFYDSYAYDKEIPSIALTKENFNGAFTVGGFIDETIYYIEAQYVRKIKNGDDNITNLEIETCNIEKFGAKHRELFKDEPLNNSYCLKNVNQTLEGYSYLDRFSYFNLQIYPCVNQTKDGRPCRDYNTIYNFFKNNFVEFKMQDNLLTPENYKSPVKSSKKDITCPIFLHLYQKTYSYIQIVRVETNEDITGIDLIPKNKEEVFTKYQDSFVITAPGTEEILKTGGPVCDLTLQLAANVLTQRRNYKTLLDVMEEVGGLMEFLFSFFKFILSFMVNESYEKSLLNNLFSFDKKRKIIIFKNKDVKNNIDDSERINDISENENDNKIYKDKYDKNKSMINYFPNFLELTNIDITSNSELTPDKRKSNGKKEEKKAEKKTDKKTDKKTEIKTEIKTDKKNEEYGIVENINKICLCLRNKKRNLEKIFFEEGMKLIKEKLDISNLFVNSFRVEINKEQLIINSSFPITKENREYIAILEKTA